MFDFFMRNKWFVVYRIFLSKNKASSKNIISDDGNERKFVRFEAEKSKQMMRK